MKRSRNEKYLLSEPLPTDINKLMDVNEAPNLPYSPSEIKDNQDLYKEFSEFKAGKQDWYSDSHAMRKRIAIMKFFSDVCLKQHNEMISSTSHSFGQLMPFQLMKNICSVQEHRNYTMNENQFNMLLTLQGFVMRNFTHLYIKRDMRFRDMIDAQNIEYNNPFARTRIRQYNSTKNDLGLYYSNEIRLNKFILETLPKFFPLINGIWCDSFHFAHVSILEMTRVACEYGFFTAEDCPTLVKGIVTACQSIKKLQDAWNEKCEREEDEFKEEERSEAVKDLVRDVDTMSRASESPLKGKGGLGGLGTLLVAGASNKDNEDLEFKKLSAKAKMRLAMEKKKTEVHWQTSEKKKRLDVKMTLVAKFMATCKTHIAHITIHMITLMYDQMFTTIFPSYIYRALAFVSEDAEKERMILDCSQSFPFYNPQFKNALLEITYNFLSEIHYIDKIKVTEPASRSAIEKLFMYVSTAERDAFISSARMVTASDTKYFEFNVSDSQKTTDQVFCVRNSIIILLDHLANKGFNRYGVIVNPISDDDPNFSQLNLFNPKFKKQKQGLFSSFIASSKDKKRDDDAIKVGDNIFDMLNIVMTELKNLSKDTEMCVSMSRQSLPLLILTLMDYISDYLSSLFMRTEMNLNIAVNTNIRHQMEEFGMAILDVLYKICVDNNLAKAQVFKGDGAFHLLNLLNRQDVTTAIFMNKMTAEINIGAYITAGLYQALQDVYTATLTDVIASFDPTDENMKDPDQPEEVLEDKPDPIRGSERKKKSTSFSEAPTNNQSDSKRITLMVGDDKSHKPDVVKAGRLILPCIESKHYNHIPYVFLIVLNRFWDNLFKRVFLNERMRVRNMLALQEALYQKMNDNMIPIAIKILEDPEMEALGKEDLISTVYFDAGKEYELTSYLLKTKFTTHTKMQLQLNCCTSALRVMNKIVKSVYSKKVMDYMKPSCLGIRTHLIDVDFNKIRFHTPKGKNSEFIKLLRFLLVANGAGWLIDRDSTFEKEKVCYDEESQFLVIRLLNKSRDFYELRFNDGIEYSLGGILPMTYKYVMAFYNLIDYKDKDEIMVGLEKMGQLIECFIDNNDLYCEYSSNDKFEKLPAMFSWGAMCDNLSASKNSASGKDKIELADELRTYCEDIIDNIELYFEGWPQYFDLIAQYQPVSEAEFNASLNASRFKEKITCPHTIEKLRVLNCLIGVIKDVKREYMFTEEEKGLTTYFKRNKDNLAGIFDTCIDRLYGNIGEANLDVIIAKNPAMNNYWMNPSIFYYLQTMEILFASGNYSRIMFLNYINEEDPERPEVAANKKGFLCLLMKLNSDLMFFLTAKPTVNAIWWNICGLYALINRFFKSLCSGNYIEMKEFLGGFVPRSKWDPDFNSDNLNVVAFKVEEMIYLLKFS